MERKSRVRRLKKVGSVRDVSRRHSTRFSDNGVLKLRFGEEVVELNYMEHLHIDENNLDTELAQQPALYTYYARLLGMQKALVDSAKNELREYEAKLYTFIKNRLATASGGRRPTEAEVSAKVNEDPQLKERRRQVIELQLQLDVLWSIRDSLAQKKDCLMTLAANRRREWDTDLFLNKRKAFEDSRRRNKS